MTPSDTQGALETLRAYIHRPGAQAVSVTDPQHEAKVALDLLRTAIAEGERERDRQAALFDEYRHRWENAVARADALRQKVEGYEAALEAFCSHVAIEATPIQNGKPMSEPEVLKLTWLGEEARQVRQALEQPTHTRGERA